MTFSSFSLHFLKGCAAVSGWKRLNEISTNPSLFAESSDEVSFLSVPMES